MIDTPEAKATQRRQLASTDRRLFCDRHERFPGIMALPLPLFNYQSKFGHDSCIFELKKRWLIIFFEIGGSCKKEKPTHGGTWLYGYQRRGHHL